MTIKKLLLYFWAGISTWADILSVLLCGIQVYNIKDSERSDECIDFTMIITCQNIASISNFGAGFRWQSEYPW
ncbi:Uncharacterized protein FWK35_00023861 [Aphis craccivora]|uniref:Uncharacterized protein n=1 Tax=Aphis craccivora TaxID=307492 RepID=A0A6G0Y5K0_APHCR|nr:Uncharacterized protein FWK35_00023861 [Aphis craccivora]